MLDTAFIIEGQIISQHEAYLRAATEIDLWTAAIRRRAELGLPPYSTAEQAAKGHEIASIMASAGTRRPTATHTVPSTTELQLSPFDTEAEANAAWAKVNYLDRIVSAAVGILPPPDGTGRLFNMMFILARGEAWLKKAANRTAMTIAIAGANALGPNLPRLLEPQAKKAMANMVLAFLREEVSSKDDLVSISDDQYAALRATVEGGVGGPWSGITWLPSTRAGLQTMEGGVLVEADVRLLLDVMVAHGTRALDRCGPLVYATMMLSLSKRGTITSTKLDKISSEIHQDLGYGLGLTEEAITLTYRVVGSKIPHGVIGKVIDHWSKVMDHLSLRMRITLQQAAGSGLTAVTTVKKAMATFPAFKWNQVFAAHPADVVCYKEALTAIGSDKYYGYKPNLDKAAGTRFRALVYVSKELLIKAGGPDGFSLKGYAGWPRSVRGQRELDELVTDFDTDVKVTPTQEHSTAVAETIGMATLTTGI
uniref:Hypthetical protein 3 n=1 Tax=Umea virus TaxID=2739775 RepID=A0A859D177_9MONO|nr:hypthetical protein 3 [Umea virus]